MSDLTDEQTQEIIEAIKALKQLGDIKDELSAIRMVLTHLVDAVNDIGVEYEIEEYKS